MKNDYKITDRCAAFGVSPSGYHDAIYRQTHPRKRAQQDATLTEQITTAFARSHGTDGAPASKPNCDNPTRPPPVESASPA